MNKRICALVAGCCLLTSPLAQAGIEDYVTGGAIGYLDSSTAVLMGGPAKLNQTQRVVISLDNVFAQAFCGVTNFFADADFYVTALTVPGADASFFEWVPPGDMVYVVVCVQYDGTPGVTMVYGRRFQIMSLEMSADGVPAQTRSLPVSDDLLQRLRDAADAARR